MNATLKQLKQNYLKKALFYKAPFYCSLFTFKKMQRINQHADRYINFNDPDSIENYAPEDQFEFIPDNETLKTRFIDFLLDRLIDPLRMQLIKRFNIFNYKPARGVNLLKNFEVSAANDINDFLEN